MLPTINPRDFLYIAPEIVLSIWGLLVLVVDFCFLNKWSAPRRRRALGYLSLLGCVATIGTTVALAGLYLEIPQLDFVSFEADPSVFGGLIAGHQMVLWMNLVLAAMLAMVVGISMTWDFTEHWGEYYALLFWAGAGMMLLVAAEELLTLFLTLETMTLCLYMATGFEKSRRRSAEGALKYFVYGSVSSALFLFGLSLIYGLTGTTRLEAIRAILESGMLRADANGVSIASRGPHVHGLAGNVAGATALLLVLVGFGFKVAAVPFHQWAPDAYEGAPAPVSAWIAAGSKLASFVAMLKVLVHALGPWSNGPDSLLSPGWVGVVAVIAGASMTFGNLAALAQRNLKRMLAYSSVAHAGYILVGVLAVSISLNRGEAAGAVLFYLIVYGFTTIGAFALAAWLAKDVDGDELSDLNGLGFRSPALAVAIVLLMLSLIGMPPLAGFWGKLFMFMEAMRTAQSSRLTMIGLVALGLINSVISAFYYVRVLKAMFLRPPAGQVGSEPPGGIRWPIIGATAVAVGFGVYPTPLLETAKGAATLMLTTGEAGQGTSIDPKTKLLSPEEVIARDAEISRERSKGLSAPAIGGGGGGGAPPRRRPSPPPR